MGKHNIIVVGASSGGVEALIELFLNLKRDLNASIFVVVHIPPGVRSYLPNIISRAGCIPAVHAQDEGKIDLGRAYIAPPGRHLVLQDGLMRLIASPAERSFRPAIDPLFESAAASYGPQTIGVVLSGNLNDGTHGLLSIHQAGGITIVQDPTEAPFPSMPASALKYMKVDYTLPVSKIGCLLNDLTDEPVLTKGENPPKAPLLNRPVPGGTGSNGYRAV